MSDAHWSLRTDGGIAWLTFDQLNVSANVLSRATLAELDQRLQDIESLKPRGVVISSAKKSGFIAGADIKEFTPLKTPGEAYELIKAGQRVLDRLEALPCPTVALIQGFALGGGLELALACDYRLGVDDGRLSLGFPEVKLGIHPGFGGTVRSVRLVGVRVAMEMMLTGKNVDAKRAHAIGLVDGLSKPEEARAAAIALIDRPPAKKSPAFLERVLGWAPVRPIIARQIEAGVRAKARREHYPAPYAMIDLWRKYAAAGPASYEGEARSIADLMCSPTARNLVRVFFLQERLKTLAGKAKFEGKHLHVVGAGVMGGDIAAWAALRGLEVTLQDRTEDLVRPALERSRTLFEKRIREAAPRAQAAARLRSDVSASGVADADIVIEAIYENMQAKQAIYTAIEPQLKAGAVLATNTSSIELESLSATLANRGNLVGIHFFNPVAQMQLVEVVSGAQTSAEVSQRALAFVRRLDKLPLPCKSAPGFVVNRMLVPYLNEALFALEEGIAPSVIDQVGVAFGMPMGPVELADVVGLDVCLSVGRVLAEAFGRPVPESLSRKVEAKKLGRKTGEGFYVWADGKPVHSGDSKTGVAPADLEDRLILPMLNEGVAILAERIVDDADLLDAGVIFGTGFAPFRGGPLAYAKSRGAREIQLRLRELAQRYGDRFAPNPGWDQFAASSTTNA